MLPDSHKGCKMSSIASVYLAEDAACLAVGSLHKTENGKVPVVDLTHQMLQPWHYQSLWDWDGLIFLSRNGKKTKAMLERHREVLAEIYKIIHTQLFLSIITNSQQSYQQLWRINDIYFLSTLTNWNKFWSFYKLVVSLSTQKLVSHKSFNTKWLVKLILGRKIESEFVVNECVELL